MTLKTITASIALLGLAVGTAQAGGPAAPPAEQAQATTTPSPQQTQQERRVVRDSVTGKLRAPTEEELAAQAAQRNARAQQRSAPAAPLVVRQHATAGIAVQARKRALHDDRDIALEHLAPEFERLAVGDQALRADRGAGVAADGCGGRRVIEAHARHIDVVQDHVGGRRGGGQGRGQQAGDEDSLVVHGGSPYSVGRAAGLVLAVLTWSSAGLA